MVLKRVDKVEQEDIEGFTYVNYNGDEEKVVLDGTVVKLEDGEGCESWFYIRDIPNLIIALQAAYDHKGN
jgi:hypothetical protein